MTTTAVIFDIETCIDHELISLTGYEHKAGSFAPLIYHLPIACALGSLSAEGILISVESLLADQLLCDSRLLTEAIWDRLNHAPMWVTFNGRSFDIPVLELCALRYGCLGERHWSQTQGSRYRYGKSHIDMLDILSNYSGAPRGYSLSNLVQLLGYQGKDGMDGSMVQQLYDAGQYDVIRAYNRRDILCTYALWLQWARISGRLTPELYEAARVASKPFLDQIRCT